MSLQNKKILVGVTGGIAAYKTADLVRRLIASGAQVRVAMTQAACDFVTPLTFQALSGQPVHTDLLDPNAEAAMGHIQLARWADAVLIAPASANFMAKLAHGLADDLLSTLVLASRAPLAIAPAMNQAMWSQKVTRDNVALLNKRNVHLFGPGSGAQACGDIGPGRMLEPSELVERCAGLFQTGILDGKHLLITAGPTREAIDPVRYLSNHSSGKMGFALAQAAIDAGAKVTLVAGPVKQTTPEGCQRLDVISAEQMLDAVMQNIAGCDVFIAAAAVADFRIEQASQQKLKKAKQPTELKLVPNTDILAAVAALVDGPYTLGFAAETENLEQHAKLKLKQKKLDMIAANQVGNGMGFDADENALSVYWFDGECKIETASKSEVAVQLLQVLARHLA